MNDIKVLSNDNEAFEKEYAREKKIKELKNTKEYDKQIVDFYNNGIIVINNIDIPINKINIIKDIDNNYFIDIVNPSFKIQTTKKIKKIISYKNTSLFENLINKYKNNINGNRLVMNNEMALEFIKEKWDGNYHSLVAETDYLNSINNK